MKEMSFVQMLCGFASIWWLTISLIIVHVVISPIIRQFIFASYTDYSRKTPMFPALPRGGGPGYRRGPGRLYPPPCLLLWRGRDEADIRSGPLHRDPIPGCGCGSPGADGTDGAGVCTNVRGKSLGMSCCV